MIKQVGNYGRDLGPRHDRRWALPRASISCGRRAGLNTRRRCADRTAPGGPSWRAVITVARIHSRLDPKLANARRRPRRPKFSRCRWSDPRLRNIVWQVLIIGTVVALVWYLVSNTDSNLAARHIATGFGLPVPVRVDPDRRDPDRLHALGLHLRQRAILIGILNTLKVAVVGDRAGDHPRHAVGRRPAVAQLAAGEDHRSLCGVRSRYPGAAAAVLLVRPVCRRCRRRARRSIRCPACSCPTAASSCRRWTGIPHMAVRCWPSSSD